VDDQSRVPMFFTVSRTGYEWQDSIFCGMLLPVNAESQGRVTDGNGSITTLDEPDGDRRIFVESFCHPAGQSKSYCTTRYDILTKECVRDVTVCTISVFLS